MAGGPSPSPEAPWPRDTPALGAGGGRRGGDAESSAGRAVGASGRSASVREEGAAAAPKVLVSEAGEVGQPSATGSLSPRPARRVRAPRPAQCRLPARGPKISRAPQLTPRGRRRRLRPDQPQQRRRGSALVRRFPRPLFSRCRRASNRPFSVL